MTGHTPTSQGNGRPVQLSVVACQPGRAEDRRCHRRREEEQVDLFPVVARADEGEGLRPVGHTGDGSGIVLGLGSALMGIYACFERFSSMKQLSVPESTRNATGRESWPQSRVLLRTRWEEQGGQEETALGSTPACAGVLTLLAACDR